MLPAPRSLHSVLRGRTTELNSFGFILPVIPWLIIAFSCGSYYLALRLVMPRTLGTNGNTTIRELPTTSIIVPTYNECKTIGAMLRNTMGLAYPSGRIETIVVDGGSDDGTRDVVDEYVRNGSAKLVTQTKRSGWNDAVREGLMRANGEIAVLSGSEVFYEQRAITWLCDHFVDPRVGAVVGKQTLYNAGESLATQMEREYRISQDVLMAAESKIDQPFDVKGEILAVRKWILERAIERLKYRSSGVLDACAAYETRAQGMRLVFEPRATYSEYAPRSIPERLGMQVRRGKILIESTLPYLWMVWNPRFGKFGTMIFPFHLFLLVAIPWLFFVGWISFFIGALSNPLYLMILSLPIAVSLSRRGRTLLSSFTMAQVSLAIAMGLIVINKNLTIKRIDSTRRIPKNEVDVKKASSVSTLSGLQVDGNS